MNKRIFTGAILSGVVSVVLAGSAAAGGGGGGFLPPGTYHFTDTSAFADISRPDGTFAFVSVDRGTHHFQLKKGSTLPPGFIAINGTVVNMGIHQPDGSFLNGCWVIPDSDFTVASGLTSASLHTTVPAASNCPGFEAVIGTAGVTPKGSGGGGTLPGPLTISLDWTSLGTITRSHNSFGAVCDQANVGQESVNQAAASTAQGTLSPVSGTLSSDFAVISSGSSNAHSTGIPGPNCLI
jgi:hypothetical protein